jgi:RNA polymerase sigma-70 factor, ECF subfamily
MSHVTALTPVSDDELACRAGQGCAASFEQLLRRFQAPVLQFLRHRGLGADAEDVTQETFLRVYENLHRYSPRWAFSAWLFTIARRTASNHRRRVRPVADAMATDAAASGEAEPLAMLITEESRRRLWDLAARVLSEEQTTALWLFYVEDMPVRGIAQVLGRSRASVKIMLFRARRKLLPLVSELGEQSRRQSGPRKEMPRRRPCVVETEVPYV